ncbi:MAG: hypothetical protein R6U94_03670 [Nitriliruptoraceae bacterium]
MTASLTSLPSSLVLVLALAGCGGAAQPTDAASQAPMSDDAPADQPMDSGDGGSVLPSSDDDGATRLALPEAREVHDGVRDASPRPFERARSDETDGSLHVIYWSGVEPCSVLGHIEVDATADQVTVTLLEGYLPEDGHAPTCIEIAEEVSAQIPLDGLLDGRVLVDGATDEPVPVDIIKVSDAAAG